MKMLSWPRLSTKSRPQRDSGAREILLQAAAAVEARSETIFRGRGRVTGFPPEYCAGLPLTIARSRVWSALCDNSVSVWCALDDVAAASLLELVIGGPGAAQPTALERSIVTETVERLLQSIGGSWNEQHDALWPDTQWWRATLRISTQKSGYADLVLLAAAAPNPAAPVAAPVNAGHVPLNVVAVLSPVSVRLETVLRWTPGSVLALDRPPDALILLQSGRTPLAVGRLGQSNGRRVIKVESIALDASQ